MNDAMSTTQDPHIDPAQLLFRAAGPADIDAFDRIANASATGITTLPADRTILLDKLERSAQAFASLDDSSGEEIYLFVVEDLVAGRVVGTSGKIGRASGRERV